MRTCKIAACVSVCIALTGCATTRYSAIYCVGKDQALPQAPSKVHDQLNGQADHDLTIVAGSAIRLRAWGDGLANILEGCREPQR
jgi:hypothetical protein